MRLLPKSIHWCRRYPTKFNSGRDIPGANVALGTCKAHWLSAKGLRRHMLQRNCLAFYCLGLGKCL